MESNLYLGERIEYEPLLLLAFWDTRKNPGKRGFRPGAATDSRNEVLV